MSAAPAAGDGTRLVLVRHGESQSALVQRMAGHQHCLGLSERGRAQVAALRDRLLTTGELGDDLVVYTSLIRRAAETAAILAPALGGAEAVPDCCWCERHFDDDLDGVAVGEFQAVYPPPPGGQWDPDHRRGPGGETWNEMAARVGTALDRVVAEHPGRTIVVACHGGIVAHAMVRHLDLDVASSRRGWFSAEVTSLTEFRRAPSAYGGRSSGWELRRYNDVGHLAGKPELLDA
jgi:probable phosphoglycerate mutase